MSEDAQSPLQRSLAELSSFLVSDRSVADTLTRVAGLAVESIPPAMFAGITVMVDDRVSTQAFADPTCPQIDQAQYEAGGGRASTLSGRACTREQAEGLLRPAALHDEQTPWTLEADVL
jgi:hypothetical protein